MEHLTAKPIVLVKVDREVANQLVRRNNEGTETTFYSLMQDRLDEKFSDYHVLLITFTNDYRDRRDMVELECFYPSDFPAIDYEQLKAKIQEEVNSITDAPIE